MLAAHVHQMSLPRAILSGARVTHVHPVGMVGLDVAPQVARVTHTVLAHGARVNLEPAGILSRHNHRFHFLPQG